MKNNSLWVTALIFCLVSAFTVEDSRIFAAKANNEITLHIIDVGQGDSIFIALPGDENILIDAGSPSGGPKAVEYIKSLGVKKINHFIITHPHNDHMGGIFSIASAFEIVNFYDNGFSNFHSDSYGEYIQLVRKNLYQYNILQAGETLLFGNVRVETLNPLLPPTGHVNNDSIVLRLHYGDIKILLAGDLGQLGEKRLLNMSTNLSSHILKVGHHGENDACSDDFLKLVNPEIAIISVSRANKYARPHQDVLNRLTQIDAKIYRTDMNGDIVIKTDGNTYSVKTEK